jgi:hypothetical protein
VYTINADGTGREQLTSDSGNDRVRWQLYRGSMNRLKSRRWATRGQHNTLKQPQTPNRAVTRMRL